MKESNESFQNDSSELEMWDYIRNNPRIAGIPISENKGLDILNALRDIWVLKTVKEKNISLTILADVILSTVTDSRSVVLDEVVVQEAMLTMDEDIKEILNEGQ
jgi:hypothetical protein